MDRPGSSAGLLPRSTASYLPSADADLCREMDDNQAKLLKGAYSVVQEHFRDRTALDVIRVILNNKSLQRGMGMSRSRRMNSESLQRAMAMSQSQGSMSETFPGETATERDDLLTEACSVSALISRGIVSGSDVVRLFARLAALMDACVEVVSSGPWDGVEFLSEGLHIARKELWIPIGRTLALRITAHSESFSSSVLEIARLLALPLSACLAPPMATQALHANPGETLEKALLRLDAYAKLNLHGEILEWSETSLLLMRNKRHGITMEEGEAALLSAAQAFLRGERVLQRITPDLVATFAFMTQHARAEEILIAALHEQTESAKGAMYSPAAVLLTPTEMRIVALLVTGKSETVIAKQLDVSRETIRTHRKRIYQKVGAESRAGLVLLFTPASQY